jgi:peptidoglycan hydrolase-like protein with peptidoglycan-binding domain
MYRLIIINVPNMTIRLSSLSRKLITAFFSLQLCLAGLFPGTVSAATDEELRNQIIELTRILAELKAQQKTGVTSQSATNAPVIVTDWFTDPVVFGAENNSVKRLQEILKTDVTIYPEGLTSGYFGALTENALNNFQSRFGLTVSGQLSDETEFVLNYALSAVSLQKNPTSYLTSATGVAAIQSGVRDLLLRDVVKDGVVILREQPVFSETILSTDTATMQRILISRGAYRGLKVTGIMDAITIQSVSEFLRTYGVPYTAPKDGILKASSVMTDDAVALLRKILTVNNAATIKSNLLMLEQTKPSALIPNNTRTISVLRATRDYRDNVTKVRVMYEGGVAENFQLTVVSPNRDVAAAVAKKLDRPLDQVTAKIKYDSAYGDDFKSIKLTVYTNNEMLLNLEYKDGKKERRYVSAIDVTNFVAFAYGGDYAAYKRDFEDYVEKARKGEPIDRVYELVAISLATTKDKVKAILTIDVEQYASDPCYQGINYVCGGA